MLSPFYEQAMNIRFNKFKIVSENCVIKIVMFIK